MEKWLNTAKAPQDIVYYKGHLVEDRIWNTEVQKLAKLFSLFLSTGPYAAMSQQQQCGPVFLFYFLIVAILWLGAWCLVLLIRAIYSYMGLTLGPPAFIFF